MRAQWKRTIWLAGVSVVSRTPGFLIPVLVGSAFGAGPETDAYFLAYGAVLLIGGTLAQAVESAIVPYSAANAATAGGRFEDRSARLLLFATIPLWLLILPVVVVASPGQLGPGVARYALILSPLALLWPVCSVYSGALIARWQIAASSFSVLWRGAGALAGVLVAVNGAGLPAVAVGLAVGELFRVWWLRKQVWSGALVQEGGPVNVRGFAGSAGAQMLAGGTGAVAPFLERLFATTLGVGGVSRVEYANRLLVVPAVLFEGALAPLLLARWSNDLAGGRSPTSRHVAKEVGTGLVIAGGLAALIVLLAPTVVRLLLGYGRLSNADLEAVTLLLRCLSVGFVATMGALLLERLYLAHARNRRLAGLALLRAGLRIGVLVVLLPRLGLVAFAAGYATAEWGYLLALTASLRGSKVIAA